MKKIGKMRLRLCALALALCLLALGVLCLLKFTQPREDRKTRR